MGKKVQSRWNTYKNYKPEETFIVGVHTEVTKRVDKMIEIALRDIANQILEKADENVPEDEGDLRESGRVERVEKIDKNTWQAEVIYGNSEVNYAAFVELNIPTGVVKQYTRPGSGPYYLSRAGDEITSASNIKKALENAAKQV